jgi:hypothetical protein
MFLLVWLQPLTMKASLVFECSGLISKWPAFIGVNDVSNRYQDPVRPPTPQPRNRWIGELAIHLLVVGQSTI